MAGTGQLPPIGPCNFGDAAVGRCGCDQFWDTCSTELYGQSAEQRPISARSTWCVCGHHACFHQRVSRPPQQPPLDSHRRATPSQASTTGLPPIPSVCLLSHQQHPAMSEQGRYGISQSRQMAPGLGLSMMHLESMGTTNRLQSPMPTLPDTSPVSRALRLSQEEPELPATTAHTAPENILDSPARAILGPVLEFNRNLQLDVPGDTIPNTYNPEDYIHSATEVATPSVRDTPDLGIVDQVVHEGKQFIDTLARVTSSMQQPHGPPPNPQAVNSNSSLLPTNSPSAAQEQQLQQILQRDSPDGIQKLITYLAPLHNLLNSIPNVAKTMQDLGSRLDMLESGSFNYVQPEDLNQTLDMFEGRLIEVEHRIDEHDKNLQAMDVEQSTNSSDRRSHPDSAMACFGSNQSIESTTSSALLLAAMDRKSTETEIDAIKDRLDQLEAIALPTSLNPWEIEVVLLPWGPELRGIWFAPDEPMHRSSDTATPNSEDWTQARHSRIGRSQQAFTQDTSSSPHPMAQESFKSSVFSSSESGWDSQAISNWASGHVDEWLFPKACASKNLVYQRLQSRGFVKNVTLGGSSARDIEIALLYAFAEVSEHLAWDDTRSNPMIAEYPGLRAPFIPLRKVLKQSKLQYLTPAEMSTSALWSAQFLATGVMMRLSGGKKRLYVTTREAYTQKGDFMVREQTWPELRSLPRIQIDQDSQMEGSDKHCQPQVSEADAKEVCWQFVEAIDALPVSIHSSFGSDRPVKLSMRPSDRKWRRSITPSSILKNRPVQPISPLSENPPRRPEPRLRRTTSASVIGTSLPGTSKRRLNSSPVKQASAPQPVSRTPSVSVTRMKRRRVAHSSSPNAEERAPAEAQATIWNPTPRRSREPPSPFYSSQPALPRSVSDVASRPSQRSVTLAGKSTPFAYATPYSGPFLGGPVFGGGDTEPDDDDGEQSWRGVTDGDEDGMSSSSSNAVAGAEEAGSFSADGSGFGSDSGDDDGGSSSSSDDGAFGAQLQQAIDEDSEDDVLDSLLDVLGK